MGRRGPKPQPDWLKELRGNPHGHRLNFEERLPTRAEVMATAGDETPLGFLERHARSGGDQSHPKPVKRPARGQT
jgi:hypothetical protein